MSCPRPGEECFDYHCGGFSDGFCQGKPPSNFEKMKEMPIEELASFICYSFIERCTECIATNYCKKGHNGMVDWLNKQYRDKDYSGG